MLRIGFSLLRVADVYSVEESSATKLPKYRIDTRNPVHGVSNVLIVCHR